MNNQRLSTIRVGALVVLLGMLGISAGCGKTEAPAPAPRADTAPAAAAPAPPAADAAAAAADAAANAAADADTAAAAPAGDAANTGAALPADERPTAAPPHKHEKGDSAPIPQQNVVKVFFGTDRSYRPGNAVVSQFGSGRGTSILYGTAEVSIPPDHRLGNLESPSLLRLQFSPDPQKHVVLQKISVLMADEYFRLLGESVQGAGANSALIFVHGYNVSFADAARRTAQMTYDLQFPGAPIFFSWPSAGKTKDYAVDETNVEWARPHLTQFLAEVLAKTDAKDVYLIAHSMGNRALVNSVADLQVDHPELRAKIREIILAAPDIDADTFRDEIAPRIISAELPTTHLTLYASSRDDALLASKKFHGYARAGDAGDLQLNLVGLEYIDASSVDTEFLGHSYYGDNRSVIADIHYLIEGHLRACKRFSLKEIQIGGGSRCVFAH
jgi:esterase/lipase superfamily enzyme